MESEKVKETLSKEQIIEILKKRIENINPWETHALEYHKGLLDLINELESKNERLLEQRNKTYNIWAKDTEQLKDRIAELEKRNKDYHDRLNNAQTYIDNHEEIWKLNTNNALKQFAERVKMEFYYEFDELIPSIMSDKIDKLLKELKGE